METNPNLFYELSDYDFSIYLDGYTANHRKYAVNGKTDGTILVNKKVLNERGIPVPVTYEDLTDSVYYNLIAMPHPMSSGTGYAFYNGLLCSTNNEAYTLDYFSRLSNNVKEYTSSGSKPSRYVKSETVAIGVGLLWQCVNYANENPTDLEVVFLKKDSTDPVGEASYNLFTMGMISGKQERKAVKDVFDYLYNDLNKIQCEKFNPDKIYVNQGAAQIPNYPTGFSEINMQGVLSYTYKKGLFNKWENAGLPMPTN